MAMYFAYGSNMSLEQMRRRCPDAIYVGVGILEGHVWQINERGYANVMSLATYRKHAQRASQSHETTDGADPTDPTASQAAETTAPPALDGQEVTAEARTAATEGTKSTPSTATTNKSDELGLKKVEGVDGGDDDDDDPPNVEGLVFNVPQHDVETLDICEGVSSGCYDRTGAPVKCWRRKDMQWIKLDRMVHGSSGDDRARPHSPASAAGTEGRAGGVAARFMSSQGGVLTPGAEERGCSESWLRGCCCGEGGQGTEDIIMVYMSRTYTTPGEAHGEYRVRMERALADAEALGMSKAALNWVRKVLS